MTDNYAYCRYYRATIERKRCWFFTAVIRSYEHLCFDRTYDVGNSIFEFFVPEQQEKFFLDVMRLLEQQGVVTDLTRHDNRLLSEHALIPAGLVPV